MIQVEVRQADAADVEKLVARATNEHEGLAERARFDGQTRGESLLLIAWEGDEIRGRLGRLYLSSKYDEVRDAFGDFPEINGLDAWPQGAGIGTQLIAAAEAMAIERGFDRMGIAVLVDNVAARRLYERLGYEYWGDVVDVTEYRNAEGEVIHVARDAAVYLIKTLP